MRYHFWQFLINQEGQPINEASISVYVAGTTTPVTIYKGELTADATNVAPQLYTNSNGYFEFWIGDEEEPNGYNRGTKIKLAWNREGIASGIVDNIEVFQSILGVDETDPDSTYKNKLISNALVYQFDTHSKHDVLEDGFPIHGLMTVDTGSTENVFNRVISNKLGNGWETHKNYEFAIFSSEQLEDSAHGLQPIQFWSSDATYNKLMSNSVLNDINESITSLNFSFTTETIVTSGWTLDSPNYYFNVLHDLGAEYPFVVCWDINTNKIYTPDSVEMIDSNNIKVTHSSPIETFIRISRL